MSAVNVLAVLDELADDMGDTPGTTGDQVAEVRAAVAELIEAVGAGQYVSYGDGSVEVFYSKQLGACLLAALARCRGGAE